VTSTINAPGETTPPLTNTNVDTTTNFTLPTNPNPLGNDTAGGSMASAMPSYPAGTPGMTTTRPRTSPRITNAPVVTDTIGSTTISRHRHNHLRRLRPIRAAESSVGPERTSTERWRPRRLARLRLAADVAKPSNFAGNETPVQVSHSAARTPALRPRTRLNLR